MKFETMVGLAAIGELALFILVTALMFWLTYLCIKNGVRDGIREARGWHIQPPAQPNTRHLDEIRID